MKVLVLTADFPPASWSGIGIAVDRQVRALAQLGCEVDVLVAGDRVPGGGWRTLGPAKGARVRRLDRDRFPADPRGYDLVHVHSLRLAQLAAEIRLRFGLPLVATVHGMPHLELGDSAPARARHWSGVQRELLEACERVVFLSRDEQRQGLAWMPELAGRSVVVANGIAPRAPAAVERRLVVFAGRFAASKGLDLLSGIALRLLARHPASWVIAGGHGDPASAAAVAGLRARYPERCRCPGWLDRAALDALLARAALVLVPSRYEPFGLVALEAMAAGAPVLAADVGGLRDVVAPGSGGLRLASRDPRLWVDRALEILDGVAGARLSRLGPPFVARRFAIREMARRLRATVYEPLRGSFRVASTHRRDAALDHRIPTHV